MTTLVLMQPYFFPYLGYFQLLEKADHLILQDDVQYTKQTWINRNQIRANGVRTFFTVPVKRHAHQTKISDVQIADDIRWDRKFLNQIRSNYPNADTELITSLSEVIMTPRSKLAELCIDSLSWTMNCLGLPFEPILSSSISTIEGLHRIERIKALCTEFGASIYLNAPGGRELYSSEAFEGSGIQIKFLEPDLTLKKTQNSGTLDYMAGLSILDLLFSLPREVVTAMVRGGSLEEGTT